jgi:hypothetical protein
MKSRNSLSVVTQLANQAKLLRRSISRSRDQKKLGNARKKYLAHQVLTLEIIAQLYLKRKINTILSTGR